MSGAPLMLRHALIGMLDGRAEDAARLSEEQWTVLGAMARAHRIEPLLHHQHKGLKDVVPAALQAAWAAAFRQAAIRSLQVQRTLLQASQILAAQGIDHVALKGSWLAWHGYRHPALRPMRDIDFLVDPVRALDAFAALGNAGFAPRAASVPVDYALAHHKHLPPVIFAETGICVELHTHLTDAAAIAGGHALFDDPARIIARSRPYPFGGHAVRCPDPTDSLLHLIVHAAIDHRFDNGPLILTDIEAALQSPIDWSEFRQLARRNGWERACDLVLALARRHRSAMPPMPFEPAAPDTLLDATAAILFAPTGKEDRTVMGLGLAGSAGGTGGSRLKKLAVLARSALPTRHALAIFANVPPDTPGVWRYYPAWVGSRLRSLFVSRGKNVREDVDRVRRINAWIGEGTSGERQAAE